MTTKDEARLIMYQAVVDYLLKNTGTTDSLPNFASLFIALQQNIESILRMVQEQNKDKSGVTLSKRDQHDEIVIRATNLSGKLMAYATIQNNKALLNQVKFTKSDLLKSTDNDLVTHAMEVCDNATALLTELATYAVTESEITTLKGICSDFVVNIPKPMESKRDSKQASKALENLLKDTDQVLLKMDAVMLILRYSETGFYNHYKNSRSIVNTGARSHAVKGLVTDAASGTGLAGVTVVFEPGNGAADKKKGGGTELVKIVKFSAQKGGFSMKTLETGTYLVTATKEGYAPQSLTLYANAGELAKVELALQPL